MKRNQFIQSLAAGAVGMSTLSAFRAFTNNLQEGELLMPVLFVGHGSPMNGIEDTDFSRRWTQMAKEIAPPKAVHLCLSHSCGTSMPELAEIQKIRFCFMTTRCTHTSAMVNLTMEH